MGSCKHGGLSLVGEVRQSSDRKPCKDRKNGPPWGWPASRTEHPQFWPHRHSITIDTNVNPLDGIEQRVEVGVPPLRTEQVRRQTSVRTARARRLSEIRLPSSPLSIPVILSKFRPSSVVRPPFPRSRRALAIPHAGSDFRSACRLGSANGSFLTGFIPPCAGQARFYPAWSACSSS